MIRKRIAAVGAAIAATVLVLTGCGSGEDTEASSGGDLVIVRSQDSTTLLPNTTTQNSDIWTLQQVYETLTLNSPDGSGVQPGLATDWEESEDKLSWTFNLRPGVTFHSGKELTSADVKFSLDYARDTEDDTNLWSGEFTPIDNVEIVDDDTVEIQLNQPWSPLPSYMALFAASIYPEDFGGHDAEYMAENTDGTGPFKFDSWTKGQSLKLVKNDDYWNEDQPSVDSVTFNVVADDNTRMLQLQGGQAHINEEPSATSMENLGASGDVTAEEFDSTKLLYFNLNNNVEGLDDPKIRRAMSFAIDRESVINTILAGYGDVATSFISPGLAGHSADVDGGTFDMEQAKKLVADSEHPDGLSLTLQVTSGVQDREQLAQVAQQAWADLGIDVTIEKLDAPTLSSNRTDGNFDMQIGYATSDVSDTSQMVSFLALTKDGGIRSGYANDEVYALAEDAVKESDETKRNELYAQIQQKVADEAPIIPVAYQKALYGYSNDVEGFRPYVLGTYGLKELTLAD